MCRGVARTSRAIRNGSVKLIIRQTVGSTDAWHSALRCGFKCFGASYMTRVSLDARIDLDASAVPFTDVIDHVLPAIPGNKDKRRFYDGYWPGKHGQWMEVGPLPAPISHGLDGTCTLIGRIGY